MLAGIVVIAPQPLKHTVIINIAGTANKLDQTINATISAGLVNFIMMLHIAHETAATITSIIPLIVDVSSEKAMIISKPKDAKIIPKKCTLFIFSPMNKQLKSIVKNALN